MKLLLSLFAAAAVWTAQAQGTFEAVVNYSQSGVTSLDGTSGWTFQAVAGIQVTALGCFDYLMAGQGGVNVGLWTSGGALLASAIVTAASGLTNQTRYESITPVQLAPGQTYKLGVFSVQGALNFQAYFPGGAGFISMAPDVQLGSYATSPGGFGPPADSGVPGSILLGPNFVYNQIPEPATVTLFGLTGLLYLARRGSFRR